MSSQTSSSNSPPSYPTDTSPYYFSDLFAMASPSAVENGEPWSGELSSARARAQFDDTSSSIVKPAARRLSMAAVVDDDTSNKQAKKYPSISDIPLMTPERLARASPDNPENDKQDTILYLAYGSNLCAETFLGVRGIRPLSQVNVSAPAFDLCFDLPGAPYWEPCFANLTPRKIKPPHHLPPVPSLPPNDDDKKGEWTKGLYGVVYEVTPSDFRTILATEGGGASYKNIYTPCFVLPHPHIPENGKLPLETPFLAHTLFAPRIPPPSSPPPNWSWRRLLSPVSRPDPNYAQPSPRYLKLIRDGAHEHAMPDEYLTYLDSHLRPYEPTTFKQKIGKYLLGILVIPFFMAVMTFSRLRADKSTGKIPAWLAGLMALVMNSVWGLYDLVFKRWFGDGERTIGEEDDDDRSKGMKGEKKKDWDEGDGDAVVEEKKGLLDDVDDDDDGDYHY